MHSTRISSFDSSTNTPAVVFDNNVYSVVAAVDTVPYGTGMSNAPSTMRGDLYTVHGLIPVDNASATRNTTIIQAYLNLATSGAGGAGATVTIPLHFVRD